MKKQIVIAVFLLMVPASVSAQEEGLVEETQALAPRLNVSTFDSTAPEFSRDHVSSWTQAWSDPRIRTQGMAAPGGFPPQTHSQQVRKRRKWPYYVSGAAVFAVGFGFTAFYRPCQPNRSLAVTCSPWTSNWVLGGGIAMMGGGVGLVAIGATRK